MRPLVILLALLAGSAVSAPARAQAPASRFDGPKWRPAPADSADFARVTASIAALDREYASAPGDARTRMRQRRLRMLEADSLAERFGRRLAARAPADSVAMAQLMLLRHELRRPSLGMADSLTRTLLWEGARLLERRIGEEHPGMLPALAQLARGYETTQHLRRMVEVGERRVALLERLVPPDSLELASALGGLARGRTGLGDYDRAEADARRRLSIYESPGLGDDVRMASALADVGQIAMRRSRIPDALAIYRRMLELRTRALGPNDETVAQTHFNIGSMELQLDRVDEARAHIEAALAIWEHPENNAHSNVGAGYMARGEIARRTGDYEAARRWLEYGLLVRRRSLSPQSPALAIAIDHVAGLLEEMGDYASALPRREESLAIRARAQGEQTADYAQALASKARLLVAMGRAAEAVELAERAVAVRERALGKDDPGLVRMLNTLGDARRALDDPAGALALYRRAEAILAASPANARSERATVLRRIGQAQIALAQPAGAESSYAAARAIASERLGPAHPLTIDLTDDLAHAQRDLGRPREALATALEAERLGRERFRLQAPALSEREALRYGAVRPSGLPLALGLAAAGADPARVADVWDALVHQRGQVLDEIGERRRALRRAEASDVDSLRRVFAEASRALGAVMARGEAGDSAWEAGAAAARARLERAEATLGARSRAFRDARSRTDAGLGAVTAALPEGTALVAYTRYALVQWRGGRQRLDDRIAAFVTRPGGRPEIVPIGETARVDSLCRRWRGEMRPFARGESAAAREAAAREAGRALRRLVWDPVAERVGRSRRVFVVPEGELHLVNLAALPSEGGDHLIERGFEFHLLSSERDLLMPAASGGRGLLALGGVSFDAADSAAVAAAEPVAAAWRGPLAACASFRDVRFAPLPATREEAGSVAAMWSGPAEDVIRLEGASATEEAVKRLAPGRRVVHLATHGFFVDPKCGASDGSGRGIGGLAPRDTSARTTDAAAQPTERDPEGLEHPLRLSGLALAGANQRARAPEGAEDGILTAEEIAALDLGGVEWVVLSACETGLGTVDAGEGVFGLRRALHTAGAHTLISSLWSVEDDSASRWMAELYRRRLRERQDTVASVHGAGRDVLSHRRKAGESTHPYHWAAFVAAGDWR